MDVIFPSEGKLYLLIIKYFNSLFGNRFFLTKGKLPQKSIQNYWNVHNLTHFTKSNWMTKHQCLCGGGFLGWSNNFLGPVLFFGVFFVFFVSSYLKIILMPSTIISIKYLSFSLWWPSNIWWQFVSGNDFSKTRSF